MVGSIGVRLRLGLVVAVGVRWCGRGFQWLASQEIVQKRHSPTKIEECPNNLDVDHGSQVECNASYLKCSVHVRALNRC